VLNLKFRGEKAVAFADDVIHVVRFEILSEEKKFSNLELSKISAISKRNEISFNEQKSKIILISRRKRKELKDINI
jgi:hypothetical protein